MNQPPEPNVNTSGSPGAAPVAAGEDAAGHDGRAQRAVRARPALRLFVLAVTLAGTAIAAYAAATHGAADWKVILFLAALALAAEWFDFSLYGDSRVSLAFVPIFAATIIGGLTGVTVVIAVAILGSAFGRPLMKTAFNFGALMVAGGCSVAVLEAWADAPAGFLPGRALDPQAWPDILLPATLAGAANFAVNSALVAAAIALDHRSSIVSVWKEHFPWLFPHYLVLGVLGLGMATAYSAMGFWGIAVFLAPALMMRLSLKQYIDRTARSVLELRRAHEQLQGAHDQLTGAMDSLTRAYEGTLRSLVAALDARDSETAGHSERVAEITMAIAEEMGIRRESDEWRNIFWGALLHDVGKIAIPDQILRKPSGLTDLEWDAMREHPRAGHDILKVTEFLAPAAEIVYAHHERYDGNGYPLGLAGDEIPLGARIFAIADAFDAMTNDRAYRKAMAAEEALAEILRNSGTQFDPAAVRAFLSVYQKRYVAASPGSRLRLSETLKKAILEAAGLEKQP